MTTVNRDATELRRNALAMAIDTFRDNKQFAEVRSTDLRTARIVETARLYEEFLAGSPASEDDPIETPEQSVAIVEANLTQMGLTLGGSDG